jgi:hypothetical protein
MITRLRAKLPSHHIVEADSARLYIVDRTHSKSGGVALQNTLPEIDSVCLENENFVPIYFDGFETNALELEVGLYSKQCECILFPQSCLLDDWILAVETKYVANLENAFRENNDYPRCMVDQIVQTVNFFRSLGIIEEDRRVNAIVSFPTLIADFSGSFFTNADYSIEDILIDHKIRIRATNSAKIISGKRIKI